MYIYIKKQVDQRLITFKQEKQSAGYKITSACIESSTPNRTPEKTKTSYESKHENRISIIMLPKQCIAGEKARVAS